MDVFTSYFNHISMQSLTHFRFSVEMFSPANSSWCRTKKKKFTFINDLFIYWISEPLLENQHNLRFDCSCTYTLLMEMVAYVARLQLTVFFLSIQWEIGVRVSMYLFYTIFKFCVSHLLTIDIIIILHSVGISITFTAGQATNFAFSLEFFNIQNIVD